MSGLREAARIADIHLGCPFARDKEPECIELEDESDDDDDAILIDDENQKSRENSKTPADAATQQIEDTTHTDSQSVQKPAKTEEMTLEDENELLGIAASGDSQNAPAPSTSESVEEVTMEADKPTEEGEKKDQDDDSTALDQLIAEHKTDAWIGIFRHFKHNLQSMGNFYFIFSPILTLLFIVVVVIFSIVPLKRHSFLYFIFLYFWDCSLWYEKANFFFQNILNFISNLSFFLW